MSFSRWDISDPSKFTQDPEQDPELKDIAKRADENIKASDKAKAESADAKKLAALRKSAADFFAARKAEREADEQKKQEASDAYKAQKEAEFKADQLQAWKLAGGTEEEFEQNWAGLHAAHVKQEMEARRVLAQQQARDQWNRF